MVLRADDFGCVPDGRSLERASIGAGSNVLTATDGTLRASDTGKRIAIPGASDLVAPIDELLNKKEVADASMAAGSTTLTAVLTAQDGFFQTAVHRGLRITVAGAGPGAATLVSDVVAVPNRTTLTLADAAATTVQHVAAVLNRPDRVALSDYARANAVGVTINLGDRVITDAGMIVGQRGLNSQTAKFSSLDLGKVVTVQAAGRLVTTVSTVDSNTKARLSAPAQRAVVDGPADIWKTDSRPGFQALLAALDGLDIEAVEIEFGPGVYDFTRSPPGSGVRPGALSLSDRRNVTLRGAGAGVTILRLMPDQTLKPDSHVIEARNCRNLTVRDLSVHGAYLTMGAVNEQMHGIFINEGCEEVVIERVRVFQTAGDGIRLLGAASNKVRKVWVQGCRLIQNKRTGIAFQRSVELVWVRDCYIEMTPPSTDACIDFEPTGSTASPPSDVIIDANHLVHGTTTEAVSISGINVTKPTSRVRFTNNTLLGGSIGGVHAQDVTIANNSVLAGQPRPVMLFRGNFDRLRVEGNRIVAPELDSPGVRISALDGHSASSVRVVDNQVEVAGVGLELVDPGSSIELRGNRVFGRGQSIGIGVRLSGTSPTVHRDVRIVGNTIANFADAGIHLSTSNTNERYEGVEIVGNEIYAADVPLSASLVGIRLARPGNGSAPWVQRALIAGNRIGAMIATAIERHAPTVPSIVIAGNLGDRVVIEGDGDPEGRMTAPFGSLFLRIDAEPTAALYLKLADVGATGWVQMTHA